MLIITPIAASMLALLQVRLALGVVGERRTNKVSLGDNDVSSLQRAMRAHGNLVENAPIMLFLLGCLEWNAAPVLITALLAIPFLIGRFLHPFGILEAEGGFKKRVLGMQLTLWPIIVAAAINLAWLLYRAVS